MVVPVAIKGLFEDLRIVNRVAVDTDKNVKVGREIALNMAVLVGGRVNMDILESFYQSTRHRIRVGGHPCPYIVEPRNRHTRLYDDASKSLTGKSMNGYLTLSTHHESEVVSTLARA